MSMATPASSSTVKVRVCALCAAQVKLAFETVVAGVAIMFTYCGGGGGISPFGSFGYVGVTTYGASVFGVSTGTVGGAGFTGAGLFPDRSCADWIVTFFTHPTTRARATAASNATIALVP